MRAEIITMTRRAAFARGKSRRLSGNRIWDIKAELDERWIAAAMRLRQFDADLARFKGKR